MEFDSIIVNSSNETYSRNYNKRVAKTPKLYFYDTGLACSLLGIENAEQLSLNPYKGSLFENLIIVEFLKKRYNAGKSDNLFFWRDNTGNEIDLLIDHATGQTAVEIKSGQTITSEFIRGVDFWQKLTGHIQSYVIYGGDKIQQRSSGITILPYTEIDKIKI